MKKDTKISLLIGILGLIVGGTLGIVMAKRKKNNTSNFSNFTGSFNSVFTIENKTANPQTVTLFRPYKQVPVGVGVSISSSIDINEFNQMLTENPLRLGSITVRSNNPATKLTQTNASINVTCKSISGQEAQQTIVPASSQNQFRDDITVAYPSGELMFDGKCFVKYTVQPNTTVSLNFAWLPNPKTANTNTSTSKYKKLARKAKPIHGQIPEMHSGITFGNLPVRAYA